MSKEEWRIGRMFVTFSLGSFLAGSVRPKPIFWFRSNTEIETQRLLYPNCQYYLKPVQQSRKNVLWAYCPSIYCDLRHGHHEMLDLYLSWEHLLDCTKICRKAKRPIYLHLILEISSLKNLVLRTGFFVHFKVDFYCMCSLQKSGLK